MAFVVPAEVGHAPYAAPLVDYVVQNFSIIKVVAVREKLFPELSEDCWLLYADGFGRSACELRFSAQDRFESSAEPPNTSISVPVADLRESWNYRLRPFLLPQSVRDAYLATASDPNAVRFGDIASIGIGYVTGANDFFHLRPSETAAWNIPPKLLCPTVRNSRLLPARRLTLQTVDRWRRTDEAMLLLKIPKNVDLPPSVEKYLETDQGKEARNAYKCRTRDPWYSVPHVRIPDFSYPICAVFHRTWFATLQEWHARIRCTASTFVKRRHVVAFSTLGQHPMFNSVANSKVIRSAAVYSNLSPARQAESFYRARRNSPPFPVVLPKPPFRP